MLPDIRGHIVPVIAECAVGTAVDAFALIFGFLPFFGMESRVRWQIFGRPLGAAMPNAHDEAWFHQALGNETVGGFIGTPGADVAVGGVSLKAILAVVHVKDGVMAAGIVVVTGG